MAPIRDKPLKQELQELGYRITRQRQVILEELRKVDSHPDAKEVYDIVRHRLPNISLGTVYRNLNMLEQLGLLHRIQYGNISHYDGDLQRHFHLKCVMCAEVFNVDSSIIQGVDAHPLESQGFEVLDYKLELYGRCPNCRTNKADE